LKRTHWPVQGGPLANTQKKTWEVKVNPHVDVYSKNLNHREQKKNVKIHELTENQKNTKNEI